MGLAKDLWIEAYEELVEEYMEHRGYPREQAERAAEDDAHIRAREKMADMIDAAKDRAKSEGKWPPK